MTDRSDPAVRSFRPKATEAVTLSAFIESQSPEPARPQAPGTVREIGGRKDGTDPTRYGDWEFKGRCIDF